MLRLIGILALILTGCQASDSARASVTSPSTTTNAAPVEYQLATLQARSAIAMDDPLVGQFRRQLDFLTPRCQEGRQGVADLSIRVHKTLAAHGVDETYLSIMTHVADAMPADAGKIKCGPAFAAYGKLRTPPAEQLTPDAEADS
jgi:hypothetical protein